MGHDSKNPHDANRCVGVCGAGCCCWSECGAWRNTVATLSLPREKDTGSARHHGREAGLFHLLFRPREKGVRVDVCARRRRVVEAGLGWTTLWSLSGPDGLLSLLGLLTWASPCASLLPSVGSSLTSRTRMCWTTLGTMLRMQTATIRCWLRMRLATMPRLWWEQRVWRNLSSSAGLGTLFWRLGRTTMGSTWRSLWGRTLRTRTSRLCLWRRFHSQWGRPRVLCLLCRPGTTRGW